MVGAILGFPKLFPFDLAGLRFGALVRSNSWGMQQTHGVHITHSELQMVTYKEEHDEQQERQNLIRKICILFIP